MKLVVLESPYAGAIQDNVRYARECVADSLHRGEAPIASHLLYTQPDILIDRIPAERRLGIEAGLAWHKVAELIVFYTDQGWSAGMVQAYDFARSKSIPIEIRSLHGKPKDPPV
jgi:hypothetical protein